MKIRLAIFFCLVGLFCFGQSDSLPIANKKVLEYVSTQIGKKVKTGECFYLVKGALDIATPGWDKRQKKKKLFSRTHEYVYGKEIKQKNLCAGDIVFYEWEYLINKGKRGDSHVCIVYSIDKNGKIKVAEQNTGLTLKKSIVEIHDFDPTGVALEIKIYRLRFYRPY
ncbi:MAG: CHAP domain-containing protein [Bacteroidetes bacterium]|nr:CHAP domain-containing protein [Bacteroidota bacterium]